MFKQIIKSKSAYYCDVCGIEIVYEYKITLLVDCIFSQKVYHLCTKHGKLIRNFIKELEKEIKEK